MQAVSGFTSAVSGIMVAKGESSGEDQDTRNDGNLFTAADEESVRVIFLGCSIMDRQESQPKLWAKFRDEELRPSMLLRKVKPLNQSFRTRSGGEDR